MAPRSSQEPNEEDGATIAERRTFERQLTEFAANRGITIDFGIRVAQREIDLFRLYNIVKARGGYDAVSTEKLAWRGIAQIFGLGSQHAAAYAFSVKTAYYKNLGAYEIKYMHGREPPPVEIFENVSAKGADIMNRTVENFQAPPIRTGLANGGSDSERERTPKDDPMEVDDPASGGRTTRGLRQQPPIRQLFYPDTGPSRRHPSHNAQSPQPPTTSAVHSGYNYSNNSNFYSISTYEPRPQIPMSLRPINTPGNNPSAFKTNLKRIRDANRITLGITEPSAPGLMRPGEGFDGPSIYVRILQALRSPIPEEQNYALHHLVKISHERGDKYKFDNFPGLADGLVEYVLQVSSIFYDVNWEISYTEDQHELNILDGINGTQDILQRIACLKRIDPGDDLSSAELFLKVTKIHEAGLTIRNLCFLEENAQYLAEMPQLRDFLSIALNLPRSPIVTELRHYALEVAEQVTKWWKMEPADPLYISLISQIEDGLDRGAVLTALRAINRISMTTDDINLFEGVPLTVLRHIFQWVVLEDEELVAACLDFLYQYTAVPQNIALLLSNADSLALQSFLAQLSRLLQDRATFQNIKIPISKAIPPTASTDIPSIPPELMEQFLAKAEPERSNLWLKSVFEEDESSSITQIKLWQAYQERFGPYVNANIQLLPAAEFIKNVSTIFPTAVAKIITEPVQSFIIKGIRPRHAPSDPKERRVYTRCQWKGQNGICGQFRARPRHMFEHIAEAHLGAKRKIDSTGSWDLEPLRPAGAHPMECYWANCRHFSQLGLRSPTLTELGIHLKTHLPDATVKSAARQKHNRTVGSRKFRQELDDGDITTGFDPEQGRPATFKEFAYHNSVADDRNHASGLPLSSALILRNIARNIPLAVCLSEDDDDHKKRDFWMESLCLPLRERLLYVVAFNRLLAPYVSDVLRWIEVGTKKERED